MWLDPREPDEPARVLLHYFGDLIIRNQRRAGGGLLVEVVQRRGPDAGVVERGDELVERAREALHLPRKGRLRQTFACRRATWRRCNPIARADARPPTLRAFAAASSRFLRPNMFGIPPWFSFRQTTGSWTRRAGEAAEASGASRPALPKSGRAPDEREG